MKRDALRYLYGSTSISFIMRICGVGLLFIANVMLARALTPGEYGLYAYIIEIAAFGAVIACLGFDQIAVRIVPDLLADGNYSGLRRFLCSGIAAIIIGVLVIGVPLLAIWYRGLLPDSISPTVLLLSVLLIVALSALRFGQEVLRAARRIAVSQVYEQLVWPMALLIVAAIMLAGTYSWAVSDIVILQIAIYASCAVLLFVAANRIGKRSAAGISTMGDASVNMRTWLSIGVPLALSGMLSVFLNRGDILALGIAVPTEVIAPYTAASRFSALMVLGLAAASATTASLMREYWRTGNKDSLQTCVDRATGVSVLFAIPLGAAFIFAPKYLMAIYGPDYLAGAAVLQVLGAAQFINALTGPVALIVIVCEMQKIYAATIALAAILLAVLLAALIPPFGTMGAAISTFISLVAINVLLAIMVWRRTGIRCWASVSSVVITAADILSSARAMRRKLGGGETNA